jgi:hypothetical protein
MIGPKVDRPSKADETAAYALVTERDGNTCQRCLRGGGVNRDHRLNRSQGGLTAASNLQLLCGSGTTGCHGWATTHPREALHDGWRVPMGQTPADWPARRWFRTDVGTVRVGWALLDDEGGVREIGADVALARMGII